MRFLRSISARVGALVARLKGWRTFLAFGAVLVLSALDQLGAVDLKAVLILLGVPEASLPGVVGLIGLLGIVLRVYTTTPPLQSVPPAPPADEAH